MMNRWDMFDGMDQLRREIDQIFNAFTYPAEQGNRRLAFLPGYSARQYPLINLSEEKDRYCIEALAPGIDPDKLNISITGNVVTLSGEKMKLSDEIKAESFHRSERAAGKFVRTIELPGEVNREAIDAEYKHGVLHIAFPKSEETKPKEIQVKVH